MTHRDREFRCLRICDCTHIAMSECCPIRLQRCKPHRIERVRRPHRSSARWSEDTGHRTHIVQADLRGRFEDGWLNSRSGAYNGTRHNAVTPCKLAPSQVQQSPRCSAQRRNLRPGTESALGGRGLKRTVSSPHLCSDRLVTLVISAHRTVHLGERRPRESENDSAVRNASQVRRLLNRKFGWDLRADASLRTLGL